MLGNGIPRFTLHPVRGVSCGFEWGLGRALSMPAPEVKRGAIETGLNAGFSFLGLIVGGAPAISRMRKAVSGAGYPLGKS